MLKYFILFLLVSISIVAKTKKLDLSVKPEEYKKDFDLDAIKIKPKLKSKSNFTYWYYKNDKFGARAFHNPISFIIEGGMPGDKELQGINLGDALADVFKKVINPITPIKEYGWKKFFYYEFIPHIGKGGNWLPNYGWHLLGGGFRTRMMVEYYHYHNYKYPAVWGWATMYVLHFLNEATQIADFNKLNAELSANNYHGVIFKEVTLTKAEKGSNENDTIDAISDLLFFDWIGGLIFSYDPVNKFMTKYLHLSDWTYQSQYNPQTNRLLNNGQIYWMRYQLFDSDFSLHFISGAKITAPGITYEFMKNHQLSFGAGASINRISVDENGDLVSGSTVFTFGFYYSISDNPILTISLSLPDKKAMDLNYETQNEYSTKLNINLYPTGKLKFLNMDLGLTFAYQRGTYFLGISGSDWPLGFVFGNQKPRFYDK